MSTHHPDKAIADAQLRINAVLAELEETTGALVKDLCISRIDLTNLDSGSTESLTSCVIELERIPSQNWSL